MCFFKKQEWRYCQKQNAVRAWQLTKSNYNAGIPDFIKNNESIQIIECGSEDIVQGSITYQAHTIMNNSDHDITNNIIEGCWIVENADGTIDVVSDGAFKDLYYKFKIKED